MREREIIYMREREREGDPMREGGTHGRQADRQTDRQIDKGEKERPGSRSKERAYVREQNSDHEP